MLINTVNPRTFFHSPDNFAASHQQQAVQPQVIQSHVVQQEDPQQQQQVTGVAQSFHNIDVIGEVTNSTPFSIGQVARLTRKTRETRLLPPDQATQFIRASQAIQLTRDNNPPQQLFHIAHTWPSSPCALAQQHTMAQGRDYSWEDAFAGEVFEVSFAYANAGTCEKVARAADIHEKEKVPPQ